MPVFPSPYSFCPLIVVLTIQLVVFGQPAGDRRRSVYLLPDNIELGVLRPGVIRKFSFYVVNRSPKTVRVMKIETGCPACTAVTVPKKILAPGQRMKANVVFDSAGFSGRIQKHIFFMLGDGRKLTYAFTADIRMILRITPRYIRFKRRELARVKKLTIKIENRRRRKIRITKCRLGRSGVKFVRIVERPSVIAPGASTLLRLEVSAPRTRASIVIQSVIIETDYLAGKKKNEYTCYISVVGE